MVLALGMEFWICCCNCFSMQLLPTRRWPVSTLIMFLLINGEINSV